jgi:hypothetical protein
VAARAYGGTADAGADVRAMERQTTHDTVPVASAIAERALTSSWVLTLSAFTTVIVAARADSESLFVAVAGSRACSSR